MKRCISAFALCLTILLQCQTAVYGASITTVNASSARATVGSVIYISGTNSAEVWVSIKGVDSAGNILYFNSVLSDSAGAYNDVLKVPEMDEGTLTITAGNGGMTASVVIMIYHQQIEHTDSGESSRGNVTATSSTVSAYDSKDGKTAAVAITCSTNSGAASATAVVTAENVASLLDSAENKAAGLAGISVIEINVISKALVKSVSVSIPAASLRKLADSTDADVKINTSLGTVRFNAKAAERIGNVRSGEEVCISIAQADSGTLSDAAKAVVGNRPVYALSITSGGTTTSNFGGGNATVSIPYTLAEGEDANQIVIYYTTASGALVAVPSCVCDKATGMVTFKTTHFSNYAVGYNDASFLDIADTTWYAGFVSYLAARDLVGGTGNGLFSPDASITRAQFVAILARMSGDRLNGYTSSPFSDVAISDWYFAATQWAYATGVAVGSDGKFYPNKNITREQMAAMLYRYSDYAGYVSNAEGMPAREFSDFSSISSWAQTPIQWAVNNSIISGNPNGSYAPQANATRAQAAKMIAILLQDMIKS